MNRGSDGDNDEAEPCKNSDRDDKTERDKTQKKRQNVGGEQDDGSKNDNANRQHFQMRRELIAGHGTNVGLVLLKRR